MDLTLFSGDRFADLCRGRCVISLSDDESSSDVLRKCCSRLFGLLEECFSEASFGFVDLFDSFCIAVVWYSCCLSCCLSFSFCKVIRSQCCCSSINCFLIMGGFWFMSISSFWEFDDVSI